MANFPATMKKVFVDGIWNTFFVKWVWQTFFVAWMYETFFLKFVCRKLKFNKWKAWIYLAPAIILLLIFTAWPILNTIRLAFFNGVKSFDDPGFFHTSFSNLGFKNFTHVIGYDPFKTAVKNTLLLCFLTVPISTFLALLIAVCLNAIKPFQKLLQTIFFLPYVTNTIAIGLVFTTMFNVMGTKFSNPNTVVGLVNSVLKFLGAEPIDWINKGSSYGANLTVLTIYIVWNALPFKILVLLGGLQSVNKQYYEAAKIDGTPRWRVFTKITVPLLSPMIAYVVITGFIGGFKEYSSIIGIFGDDMAPPGTTKGGEKRWYTMVGYIYDSLETEKIGDASAAALLLFLIIFAVTMVNLYVSKKKTHY